MSCANSVLFAANELFPHCTESSQLRESGTTGFVEDWWGTAGYDRRPLTPNRLSRLQAVVDDS